MNTSLIESDGGYPLPVSGGEPELQKSNTKLRRYLAFLRRFWWMPVATLVVALGIATAYVHWLIPEFVSTASMWETEKLLLPGGAAFSEDSENYTGTQLELLRSGELAGRTVARLKALNPAVIPPWKNGQPPPVTVTVQQVPRSSIFKVSAYSSNPAYSPAYLDTLLNVYLDYKRAVRKTVSGETLDSISAQVLRMESELKSEEDTLNAYERTNNLAVVQEEGTRAASYLAKLQTELSDLKFEAQILDATERLPGREVNEIGTNTPVTGLGNEAAANSKQSVDSSQLTPDEEVELLKMKRQRLGKYLRPKHPKMVKLDEEIERDQKIIDMVRTRSADEVRASRLANQERIATITASIQEWEERVADANQRVAEAERLRQNVERIRAEYERWSQLFQNVDISRNIDQETLAILEPASQSVRTLTREKTALEAAIFCGLASGLGLVFLIAIRDDRFKSIAEVNEKFGDVIVGQVPQLPRLKGKPEASLLRFGEDFTGYAESYRNLRSAIFFMPSDGERPKVLLVTSAIPGEGKSTIVANLARTLAQGGSRVLLMDADLRKGYLHEVMGMQATPGLADVLEGTAELDAVIQRQAPPRFCFVSRGKNAGSPGDLFLRPNLDSVLAKLRSEFDYILIDTSPVFAADDAPTLAPKADGTLFVVRNEFSSAGMVKEALELLGQRQVRVLGLVFNGANSTSRTYYYYKHAEYYHSARTA